jgi:hypothetical protein
MKPMEKLLKGFWGLTVIFVFLCMAATFGFYHDIVFAGDPPREPILRIETEMHTAPIYRMAIDADNRYLVSSSDDKTVRIWSLSTGKMLKIIRPPIGYDNEGRLYSVAISPDGTIIACAGWTNVGGGSHNIYLIDRESGRIIKRIDDLPNVAKELIYSKDGRFLVATLGRDNGIRVYKTPEYSLIAEDRDYAYQSSGADFDFHGRLVTSSYDGFIRLYSASFQLIAKSKTPGGNYPFPVRFSPDGSKIAVGFEGSSKVDIISGYDLSYLYSPDTGNVGNSNFFAVAWSNDGNFLYGGRGLWGPFSIRKWSDQGRGSYTDFSAADNSIFHILNLRDGSIVYCSYGPEFGILDKNGNKVMYQGPAIADFRENREKFLVSRDGTAVQYAYLCWGESPARFSVTNRIIELINEGSTGFSYGYLSPAITSADGLNVTNWKDRVDPQVNGKPLSLDDNEISRVLAIAPDGQHFILGTGWYLHYYDKEGQELWSVPAPSSTWGINLSGNGKLAVASFGDGTIRWYRLTDGKELLAFFPHKDKKRWVMWSASGYYDASPGAEELIGWHVNNGMDTTADFFPVSKFRGTYYRPDVIAKVFDTLDEGAAIRLANEESGRKQQDVSVEKMLPPVVNIVSPQDGFGVNATELVVRFTVRTPSGEPITAIKGMVDGRPVETQRGVTIKPTGEDTREMRVVIPEKDVEIAIIAENRYAASVPATISLRWTGTKQEEFVIKPKLYVLAVGVSQYQDKELVLQYAAKDAKDFAGAVSKQKEGLYRDVVVRTLTDEGATRDEIMDGLDWITKETTSKDVAMLFMAGHGINDPSGVYYFLPANVNLEKLRRTGVAFSDIKNALASLAGKAVLFVDTCHSGDVMGKRRAVVDVTGFVNELASAENGAVVFASSTGRQYSLEDSAWGNGAFTKALVEGLTGKADYMGKGKITINMLDLYLSERVKEITSGRQTPTTTKPQTIQDFPIAVAPAK